MYYSFTSLPHLALLLVTAFQSVSAPIPFLGKATASLFNALHGQRRYASSVSIRISATELLSPARVLRVIRLNLLFLLFG